MGAIGIPSLPPIPPETGGPGGAGPQVQSVFAGGVSSVMQAVQQIEMGAKTLATQLPSLTPLVADMISKLRIALPNAVGAGAGQQGAGMQSDPAAQGLPTPPMQGEM